MGTPVTTVTCSDCGLPWVLHFDHSPYEPQECVPGKCIRLQGEKIAGLEREVAKLKAELRVARRPLPVRDSRPIGPAA